MNQNSLYCEKTKVRERPGRFLGKFSFAKEDPDVDTTTYYFTGTNKSEIIPHRAIKKIYNELFDGFNEENPPMPDDIEECREDQDGGRRRRSKSRKSRKSTKSRKGRKGRKISTRRR